MVLGVKEICGERTYGKAQDEDADGECAETFGSVVEFSVHESDSRRNN
jgi:hypothetical protein